jgi:fructose-1,6-bisphosphatase
MKAKHILSMVLLVTASSFIFSFVVPAAGGEGFQIYIDNKLVLQQFNTEMKELKNIQLTGAHSKSEMMVKYYHCGMAGKSRVLELKNSDQKTVRRWQFDNGEGKNFAVKVLVKEILDSQEKLGNGTIYLYYSSKEAPQGRLLAGIVQVNKKAIVSK